MRSIKLNKTKSWKFGLIRNNTEEKMKKDQERTNVSIAT